MGNMTTDVSNLQKRNLTEIFYLFPGTLKVSSHDSFRVQ